MLYINLWASDKVSGIIVLSQMSMMQSILYTKNSIVLFNFSFMNITLFDKNFVIQLVKDIFLFNANVFNFFLFVYYMKYWPFIVGFSIIISIIIWSYTNHIPVILYSTSAIFVLCVVTMLQGKNYNALSYLAILGPCVLLTIVLTLAYLMYVY